MVTALENIDTEEWNELENEKKALHIKKMIKAVENIMIDEWDKTPDDNKKHKIN